MWYIYNEGKEIVHIILYMQNCFTDFRNLRDVLCSAASYFIPVLEDIPSGAKEDQEEARHHSSAAARTKGHPQARHEKVVAFPLGLSPRCQNPCLSLERAIERVAFRSCNKLDELEG